ncbi:hypothetical protein [Bacillus fonticola]|uniref:hypothetical protein n=1 Tax=Bacillus fonticola TaxID=2728853 RepID=UPI0014751973|nr:hypothetical protein [Bacillus fonticola]
MAYHMDKQEAFQHAQKGTKEAVDAATDILRDSSSYGHQLAHLKEEVMEAHQQINNALGVASEHQKEQLQQMQSDLQKLIQQAEFE